MLRLQAIPCYACYAWAIEGPAGVPRTCAYALLSAATAVAVQPLAVAWTTAQTLPDFVSLTTAEAVREAAGIALTLGWLAGMTLLTPAHYAPQWWKPINPKRVIVPPPARLFPPPVAALVAMLSLQATLVALTAAWLVVVKSGAVSVPQHCGGGGEGSEVSRV